MSHRIHLFLAGAIGGLCSAAAQPSFSCTTSITAGLTTGFSQTTEKVLKGGDGCWIELTNEGLETNIAVYQDTSDVKNCGDYNQLNVENDYLDLTQAFFFEDPTVLCIVNTDTNAIIDHAKKMLTVSLVEDGLPGAQPDNTMQAYTSNNFDQTTGNDAKTADGTCRLLTWPGDVAGGVITLAVNFNCNNPQVPNVQAGVDVIGCNDNDLGGALNYLHDYGAYQYQPAGNQPVFFYVKCSAAGGGGGGAQEEAAEEDAAAVEADAAESEDLSVESASDDSDDDAAIVGGAIGGVAVLAIATVLWYRARTTAKYKLVI